MSFTPASTYNKQPNFCLANISPACKPPNIWTVTYPVRGNKDPQVTVILESLILLASSPSPPQTPATAPVVTPQLLAIDPTPSLESAPPLALPGMLLYDVLVAQYSLPDDQAVCAKLYPVSVSNGPYTLKDKIIY
ncbi:hypothetical protein DSO57_1035726 [Entomophthora muscae]|uniref:Uncharacterized protein n=1 Tax=Entomophthora muscae TaxID=34485 RepID=A0ACC2SCU8_9FUNG|nr:hypothetical protein DSO57_1035726 [Entomophthora muscae]